MGLRARANSLFDLALCRVQDEEASSTCSLHHVRADVRRWRKHLLFNALPWHNSHARVRCIVRVHFHIIRCIDRCCGALGTA